MFPTNFVTVFALFLSFSLPITKIKKNEEKPRTTNKKREEPERDQEQEREVPAFAGVSRVNQTRATKQKGGKTPVKQRQDNTRQGRQLMDGFI